MGLAGRQVWRALSLEHGSKILRWSAPTAMRSFIWAAVADRWLAWSGLVYRQSSPTSACSQRKRDVDHERRDVVPGAFAADAHDVERVPVYPDVHQKKSDS